MTICFAAIPSRTDAACNLIPGTAKSFDAILGATNRPSDGGACFEAEYQPGDFVKNGAGQFTSKGGAPTP